MSYPALVDACEHDNGGHTLLPDHAPEILHGVLGGI